MNEYTEEGLVKLKEIIKDSTLFPTTKTKINEMINKAFTYDVEESHTKKICERQAYLTLNEVTNAKDREDRHWKYLLETDDYNNLIKKAHIEFERLSPEFHRKYSDDIEKILKIMMDEYLEVCNKFYWGEMQIIWAESQKWIDEGILIAKKKMIESLK